MQIQDMVIMDVINVEIALIDVRGYNGKPVDIQNFDDVI